MMRGFGPTTVMVWGFIAGCGHGLAQGSLADASAQNVEAFPYEVFDRVLRAHVSAGHVDYAALRRDSTELRRFTAAVASLGPESRSDLFPDEPARFAYLINAYNALAMLNALDRTPELKTLDDSLTDFFYLTNVRVDRQKTDLYSLENDTIRPTMRSHYEKLGEASRFGRIHFALNCASESCPRLPSTVFRPDSLEETLDRETALFVNDARNVRSDPTSRTVTVSRIFDWYSEDFTDDQSQTVSVLTWINRYRPNDAQLDASYAVEFFDYDWTLNAKSLPSPLNLEEN
ncbi:MAG: DUF547 domain-containing protein [Myxococcota bacterium]